MPEESTFGLAESRASEKRRAVTSSRCSPVSVTTTSVPAWPPIGIVVNSRGAGRPTDCARQGAPTANRVRAMTRTPLHEAPWLGRRAAKRVVGVVGLANDIEVRPRDQRTDGEIAQAAVEALKQHTSIPQGKVRPVVKNGVVTLEGEVGWQFQREAALAAVRGLRGVKYATDQIQLKPTVRPSPSGKRSVSCAMASSAVHARDPGEPETASTYARAAAIRCACSVGL